MSTAVRAPQRTRPGRASEPSPAPRPRPRLRVVGPPVRRRPAPSMRLIVTGGVVLFVLLFTLAGFQALLVSSQQRLDELDRQVAVAQDRYQDLRVELASLEAPERIFDTAVTQLGMVPSATATYITPSEAVAAEVEARAHEAEIDVADTDAGTGAATDGPAAGDLNDVGNGAAVPAEPSASSWPDVKPYLEPTP